jgi:diguanylate cyclase (GGDEF)-like protein
MHFDIQVSKSAQNILNNYLQELEVTLLNVNFKYDSDVNNKEAHHLLIIDIEDNNLHKMVDLYIKSNRYVLFLSDKSNIKDYISNITKFDIIKKPIDFEDLVLKVKNYTNFLNNDLLLKQEQELSNSIINSISNPIFITDGKKVLFANDYFYRLVGKYSLKDINNKYEDIGNLFETEEGFLNNIKKDWLAQVSHKNCKVSILDNESLNKKYYTLQKIYLTHNQTNIIILNDISHEITHKKELYNLLYTDNLTKLPNRAKLIDELQHKSIKLQAVAILDINSFKEINDFFGLRIGDYILNEIAKLINSYIDNSHMKLYKFPSDTYCITYTKNNQKLFTKVIKEIHEIIYKKVFLIDQHEIDTRITSGISFSHKNNKLITADIALQSAKKENKDFVIFYEDLDKFQEYENNMLWTKKLKNAFLEDKIVVYYQPLVNNKTLEIEKYECLVRMIDENNDIISPFFFLDISKKSKQYTKITKIVIEKAFKKFNNLDFEFAVNISYEDIADPDFLRFIKNALKTYKVKDKVVFEILEDENIKNYELLIDFISEIKSLGCKVAIDDFGSGYSNFEHLLKMKVDYLKIDASLIKNIAIDENSYKITKTIIEFAKNLNLQTVAEYVENEDIYKIVKNLGADYSQGYYFSQPLKSPELLNFK